MILFKKSWVLPALKKLIIYFRKIDFFSCLYSQGTLRGTEPQKAEREMAGNLSKTNRAISSVLNSSVCTISIFAMAFSDCLSSIVFISAGVGIFRKYTHGNKLIPRNTPQINSSVFLIFYIIRSFKLIRSNWLFSKLSNLQRPLIKLMRFSTKNSNFHNYWV